MNSFTHRGTGRLTTPSGPADVTYVLTVTRSQSMLDGYGQFQSDVVAFAALLAGGKPLELQLEPGGSLQVVLTAAARERAVFETTAPPYWLFR